MEDASCVARVARYYAALNAYDLAAVEAMFAPDAVYRSAGIGALQGRAAIIAAMKDYFSEYTDQAAFCDATVDVGELTVRTSWRLTATSNRTGQRSERCGSEVIAFTADGFIRQIEVEDQ